MKINFTNKEFEALFDMVSIADWILHAHQNTDVDDQYSALEQKILSHAKDFGMGDIVEYDKELQRYFSTRDYEESDQFQGVIDDYDDQTFWDELINRLVDRDLIQRFGEEGVLALSTEDRIRLRAELEAAYGQEFEVNGLKSLKIGVTPRLAGNN